MRVSRRVAENDGAAGRLIAPEVHFKLAACRLDRWIEDVAVALARALNGGHLIVPFRNRSIKERDIEPVNRTQAVDDLLAVLSDNSKLGD